MSYCMGVDIGATTCAAALRRATDVEPLAIGDHGAATMPAVALPLADGTMLVGEEGDRRSTYEPTLVARLMLESLDAGGPVDVDGVGYDPLALTETLLASVIARATPGNGEHPRQVVVAFPLRPGDAPEELLREAADRVTGHNAVLVPAPVAAMARLADRRQLADDCTAVVLDVGGSSTDVTLVRRTPDAFDLVGDPVTQPDLGGTDLDATVLSLVESAIGDVTSGVEQSDHVAMLSLRRLRASCRAAREELSHAHQAVVDVALPHARAQVEITRDAYERAAEPLFEAIVDLVLHAVDDAGLIPADLALIQLTGGVAATPRLQAMLGDATGRPLVVEDAPELTVAVGAALFGETEAAGGPADLPDDVVPTDRPPPRPGPIDGALLAAAQALGAAPPPVGPPTVASPAARPDEPPAWTDEHAAPWTDPSPGAHADATQPPEDLPGWADPLAAQPETAAPWIDGPPTAWTDPAPAAPAPFPPDPPVLTGPDPAAGPPDAPMLPLPGPPPFDLPDAAAEPGGDASALAPIGAHDTDPGLGGPGAATAWDDPAAWGTTDGWDDGLPGGDAAGEGAWQDTRASVFDAPLPAAAGLGSAEPPAPDAHTTGGDEFQRLTTSDTDPFGTRSGALGARRPRDGDDHAVDHDDGSTDARILVGAALATVITLLLVGFTLFRGSGDSADDDMALAGTTSTTTTTVASTTTSTAPTTTTTEPTTTTTEDDPAPVRRPTTTAAPTPPPPPPTPPSTTPPTTRPTPTTTTTTAPPTTTTTTPPPTSSTTEPPEPTT